MLAGRWDTGTELGSGWLRSLRRRTGSRPPTDLTVAEPVSIRFWGEQGAVDTRQRPIEPRLVVPGVVSDDHLTATVALTAEQVAALGVGEWEYALVVTNPATGEPEVLTRGYFVVSGSVNAL